MRESFSSVEEIATEICIQIEYNSMYLLHLYIK